MTDVFSAEKRSAVMRAVRGKDTSPELVVRSELHRRGFRFRLHRKDLPGCPDLVFASRRKVVFVHGCFWHRHSCPDGRSTPATRTDFWQAKFDRNQRRDRMVRVSLRKAGWQVLVVWECQLRAKRLAFTLARIERFLKPQSPRA